MQKRLITVIFTLIFVIGGSKAFIALFAYQLIERIKIENHQDFALTHGWISSSFDGALTFHDVTVTPFELKRTFTIRSVVLRYENYVDLLLGLSSLKKGDLAGLNEIEIPSVVAPLGGRDFEQWFALYVSDSWLKPFGLFGCGAVKRISFDNLRAMGVNDFEAKINLIIGSETDKDINKIALKMNLFPLGKFNIFSEWMPGSVHANLTDFSLNEVNLKSLMIQYQDAGYFRRLSNFCTSFSGLPRKEFSELAAKQWHVKSKKLGLILNDQVEELYRDYLLQGGQIQLDFDFPQPLHSIKIGELFGVNLVKHFGLSILLNETPVDDLSLYLDELYFNPKKVDAVIDVPADGKELLASPDFQTIEYKALSNHLGKIIRVERQDKKVFMGRLKSIDENALVLSNAVKGGAIDYVLMPKEIIQIEMKTSSQKREAMYQ